MIRTLAMLTTILGVFTAGTAWCRQPAQTSPSSSQGSPAKTRCQDESRVLVTADSERTLPLKLVATLSCDQPIRVLSNPQGYTVKVRTTTGKVGYVTRYEVVLVPQAAQPTAASNAQAALAPATAQSGARPRTGSSSTHLAKDSSKPRLYVSDTQSWKASGGFSRASSVPEGDLYGGYDPEMTDIYQDFTSNCPSVTVTQQKSNADYAVLFDKDTGKKGLTGFGGLVKVNQVTVLSRSGETVFSQESHSADTIVRLTCQAITQRGNSASASQTHP